MIVLVGDTVAETQPFNMNLDRLTILQVPGAPS
jgi:hypothetical protein